jgi:hypothetical protein
MWMAPERAVLRHTNLLLQCCSRTQSVGSGTLTRTPHSSRQCAFALCLVAALVLLTTASGMAAQQQQQKTFPDDAAPVVVVSVGPTSSQRGPVDVPTALQSVKPPPAAIAQQ